MPNRNWKSIATPEWHTPRLCFVWHMQTTMRYAERRAAILKHLDESSGIYINCKYQVQLKDKGAYPKALVTTCRSAKTLTESSLLRSLTRL